MHLEDVDVFSDVSFLFCVFLVLFGFRVEGFRCVVMTTCHDVGFRGCFSFAFRWPFAFWFLFRGGAYVGERVSVDLGDWPCAGPRG